MTALENKNLKEEVNPPEMDSLADQALRDRLTRFGLTAEAASVYLVLLEAGRDLGGSEIAWETTLPRQYVYAALPSLKEAGLVIEVPKGKQSRYRAAPEIELEKIAKRKLVETELLVRELGAISRVGYEQDFEIIQGEEAFRRFEMDTVGRMDRDDEEYIIGGATSGFTGVMGPLLNRYLNEKKKKGIGVKYLGSLDEKEYYQKFIGMYSNQEYRFLDKLPKGIAHMVVRRDSVSFYTFLNPPLIYIVKSQAVAENYRQFFLMLWDMAEKKI